MDNSSPTNSGPDSEAAYSVDDLPQEGRKDVEPQPGGDIAEDLTNKVAAATSYVGSFFNPSSWKNLPAERSPEDPEDNSAASAGSSISSSLFSANPSFVNFVLGNFVTKRWLVARPNVKVATHMPL